MGVRSRGRFPASDVIGLGNLPRTQWSAFQEVVPAEYDRTLRRPEIPGDAFTLKIVDPRATDVEALAGWTTRLRRREASDLGSLESLD